LLIMNVAIVIGGIVYTTLQTALPKECQQRLSDVFGAGPQAAGNLFALVFALGGVIQLVGGHLADRFPLKPVYLACWFGQTAMMLAIAFAFDLSVVAFAALSVMINVAALPAENMMLYRFTPERHRGLVFGVKFVLSFLAGPVAILLISLVREITGEFVWLFAGIATATGLVALLLLALPAAEAPQPSEMPAE
ncbi:MAG: MFS transporter, partial [Alphaproteobacteria bacterium]